MEIDFLGLNSPKYDVEQESCNDAFADSANGGVETSLSLSTSSSLDSQREILNFREGGSSTNNTLRSLNASKTEQPSLVLVSTPVFRPSPITTAGFLYDLNDNSTNLRNISELPAEAASLTMLYRGCPNVFNDTLPEKADGTMYMVGNASTSLTDGARICTRTGYTPTVAMARRATLARFLEKRLHRMNQARTSHLMGKSVNVKPFNKVIARSNKKRNKSHITS